MKVSHNPSPAEPEYASVKIRSGRGILILFSMTRLKYILLKIGVDSACKLSLRICMKCQNLFSWGIKKIFQNVVRWKFY